MDERASPGIPVGIPVGRWRSGSSRHSIFRKELAQHGEAGFARNCSGTLTSVFGGGISDIRHRTASHLRGSRASSAECAVAEAVEGIAHGREYWGSIFFQFQDVSSLDESPFSRKIRWTDDDGPEADYHQHRLKSTWNHMNFTAKSKLSPYADRTLQTLGFTQPPLHLAAGAACGGLMLGLQLAMLTGLGQGPPQLIGGLSSLCALGGVASCMLSLNSQTSDHQVDLPPWIAVCLSGLCTSLAPLALVPLSPSALLSVAGPIRLALPGSVGAVVMFEVAHRNWAQIDPARIAGLSGSGEAGGEVDSTVTENLFARVVRLWLRHFSPCSPGSRGGVGAVYFLGNLAVTYGAVHIDLALTQWRNGFLTALQAHNSVGFYHQLWDFAPIALASSLATIYSGYLASMWDLRWREELTHDFVHMWLDRKAYYLVRFADHGRNGVIDNFDQRLVDDTAIFASSSRGLLCGFAEAFLRLIVFFPTLVRLSPSPTVWQFCIILSLASSIITHIVGRPLAARNAQVQKTEADFRSSLIRLRLFAEDIAMQRAEGAESANAVQSFESVKAATWMAARGTLNLVTYTSAYGLAGGVLPLLVLVPSYFNGQIDLGTMFQIEAVVGGVRSSLDFFIGSYGEIAAWRAAADRMLALETVDIQCLPPPPAQLPSSSDSREDGEQHGINVEDLVITAPGSEGAVVLEHVSFHWRPGQRIMVLGPAGCGKTALLRTLAGAWPPPTSGYVSTLGANGIVAAQTMLVTSKGFLLPVQTTLRKCLAYPESIAAFDEDLKEALVMCGLEHLTPLLDVESDWQSKLSTKDKQRLIFARLIGRWPVGVRWLFLDDVAAGLSEPAAVDLHMKLASRIPADAGLVVVSRHLEMQRQRGWNRFQIEPLSKRVTAESEGGTGETPEAEGC